MVRVKDDVTGQVSEPVKVEHHYKSIIGGVIVSPHVFGFRSWNVSDLVPA
jgi:hypothetical protein